MVSKLVDRKLYLPQKRVLNVRVVDSGSSVSTVAETEIMSLALKPIANQEFTATLNGNNYVVRFKTCGNVTVATAARNGVTLVTDSICVAGFPILPYQYLEDGNFLFYTQDGDLPDYTQFGVTQQLLYAPQSVLEVLRG